MKDFQCTININAKPKKVYEAIAEQQGLKNWWTTDCDVEPKEDSISTFRFDETYTIMKVEKLIPSAQVQWRCIDHHHVDDLLKRANEWIGTHLTFKIKDNDNGGTELNFTHQGLNKSLECYDICEERWGHFLRKSLKSYLETGQGDPYQSQR
ncbi:MAG: hypothetical protein BGO67_04210 [Alphaproteobacteria bacterium 41-28]|nr:MAG: hypothetical protein BGO67_04210 [Alphaproteobacteria bacterium 41-28]